MTRLPASALEEGDQIHAILRPLLAEPGAAERRAKVLAKKSEVRALAYAELDQTIDQLLARMRIDPRPAKQKTRPPPSREPTRPPAAEVRADASKAPTTHDIPAVPGAAIPPLPPAVPGTREGGRPRVDVPPPVPPGPVKSPEAEPARRAEVAPPPVPPEVPRAATRTGARPTPPVPAVPPMPAAGVASAGPATPRRASQPIHSADAVTGPIVAARPGDAPETFLLYDDIVTLSSMNDRDGLMISLERMLLLARLEDHIRVFIDANEAKLIGLYESQLKSFSRVPKRRPAAIDNTMPRAFLRAEKVAAILPLIDGQATIADIVVRAAPLHRIETLSVLAQLQRAGIIEV